MSVGTDRCADLAGPIHAYNFPRWKQPVIRQCFPGHTVIFVKPGAILPASGCLALWGMASVPIGWPDMLPILRLEDGFLRSVGLGADMVRPVSWVVDRQGIYYNTAGPSDLRTILSEHDFPPDLLQRAALLRQKILEAGITKYNTGAQDWQRPSTDKPIILVPGQVESDASIRYGAQNIRTNADLLRAVRQANPKAYVIYKPHPDVTARLRLAGPEEKDAARWADAIITDVAMDKILPQVDEVHVLTSLAGFEALLRQKPVTCWGRPFYAGWGLTQDKAAGSTQGRILTLDQLTAAVLFLYPLYLSRDGKSLISPEEALETLITWRTAKGRHPPPWQGIYRMILRRVAGVR